MIINLAVSVASKDTAGFLIQMQIFEPKVCNSRDVSLLADCLFLLGDSGRSQGHGKPFLLLSLAYLQPEISARW
jgi:hypothetical protein